MTANDATLVVIEFGATWPRWLSPVSARNAAVVAQHYEGAPDSLLIQVQSRLSRLVDVGWTIREVILVVNERFEAHDVQAREALADALLGHLGQFGGARLLITVEQATGALARRSVAGLASSMETDAASMNVEVVVRAGPPTPVTPPAVNALRRSEEATQAARSVQSTRYA